MSSIIISGVKNKHNPLETIKTHARQHSFTFQHHIPYITLPTHDTHLWQHFFNHSRHNSHTLKKQKQKSQEADTPKKHQHNPPTQ